MSWVLAIALVCLMGATLLLGFLLGLAILISAGDDEWQRLLIYLDKITEWARPLLWQNGREWTRVQSVGASDFMTRLGADLPESAPLSSEPEPEPETFGTELPSERWRDASGTNSEASAAT